MEKRCPERLLVCILCYTSVTIFHTDLGKTLVIPRMLFLMTIDWGQLSISRPQASYLPTAAQPPNCVIYRVTGVHGNVFLLDILRASHSIS